MTGAEIKHELLVAKLNEYIEALKAIRDLTETLPYNVPERLAELVKQAS